MNHNEYQMMFELETVYWWFVGRRIILADTIQRHIASPVEQAFDIGCGTGGNLPILSRFSKAVIGLDTSPQALDYCRSRGWSSVELIQKDGILRFADATADLVTMLDILEHVADERPLLAEIRRILRPDGLLIVTVPAFQFLWSEHDAALHHYRRYTKQHIIRLLADQGFEIISASYVITFSFPLIVLYRVLKGALNFFSTNTAKTSYVRLPDILNTFFIRILAWESKLLAYITFPFGTSVLVVATKLKPIH
ncbi:MAG: class I SAM-dependent methyltransferase [Candidatus Sungiibacteriota bacterium]